MGAHDQAMEQLDNATKPLKDFFVSSDRLLRKCTKPDRKEFKKIAFATTLGFAVMGFIGFFTKLIFIPIYQEDRVCDHTRVRRDGVHWVLHQAHLHSDQP